MKAGVGVLEEIQAKLEVRDEERDKIELSCIYCEIIKNKH